MRTILKPGLKPGKSNSSIFIDDVIVENTYKTNSSFVTRFDSFGKSNRPIYWLHSVGCYGIRVISYDEAIIIFPVEYFFCMQLRICFSNALKVLYRNFNAVLFIIADF